MDPLAAVFVFCFVFGVATSLLSLAFGALHGGDGGHALGGDHGGLHLGGNSGGAHAAAHAGGSGDAHGELPDGHEGQISPFNLQTITTFLAFFGGSGWVLYSSAEIDEAERAGLYPWTATEKLRFVRITPAEITGRRFVFGPEPDRGSIHG